MTEPQAGKRELALIRMGPRHAHQAAVDADDHQAADLDQPAADGAGSRGGEPGVAKAEPAQCLDMGIGKGSEPGSERVGLHGGGRDCDRRTS